MRNKRRNLFLLALLLVILVAVAVPSSPRAEEPTPNPEVTPDDSDKPKDVVTWNNGRELAGFMFIRGVTHLKLYNLERGEYIQVAISDMARIDVEVEKATMEKVWRFKEEGSPEKIFTGEQYPLHEYLTKVTLRNGVQIDTHLATMFYMKVGKEEEKIAILNKQAGSVTDNLEDLVYVKTIVFFDRRLVKNGGQLRVQLEGKEKPYAAVVIQWSCNQSFRAEPQKGGVFLWKDLPPDRYDLLIVTDKYLYYALSEVPPGKEKKGDDDLEELDEKKLDGTGSEDDWKLTDEVKKSVTEYIATADEFFEVKETQALGGNTKLVRALVRQKRVNETSYGTEQKKITLWRYDLWYIHRVVKEWRTESRAFLWRGYFPVGDESGVIKPVADTRLSGLDLTRGGSSVELKFPTKE